MVNDLPHETTEDAFLGGALRILQPQRGFRAGSDSVLLAASVPACPGDHIIEAGTGPGVSALCLCARVNKIRVTGVEREPHYVSLARANICANGFADAMSVVAADINMPPRQWSRYGLAANQFDHGFANPPYYASDSSSAPSDPQRSVAHQHQPEDLAKWLLFLIKMVRPKGTITLIGPPAHLPHILAVLTNRAGAMRILPLHAHPHQPAKRVLVQMIKGARTAPIILPSLILHRADGSFVPEIDEILRMPRPLRLSA